VILVVVAPRRAVAEFERVAFAFAESVAAWQHSVVVVFRRPAFL